jgi:hypothetical protein
MRTGTLHGRAPNLGTRHLFNFNFNFNCKGNSNDCHCQAEERGRIACAQAGKAGRGAVFLSPVNDSDRDDGGARGGARGKHS